MTLETPFLQRDGEVGFQQRLQKRQITICSHDKGTTVTGIGEVIFKSAPSASDFPFYFTRGFKIIIRNLSELLC
jgi:hypothetical protein